MEVGPAIGFDNLSTAHVHISHETIALLSNEAGTRVSAERSGVRARHRTVTGDVGLSGHGPVRSLMPIHPDATNYLSPPRSTP